MIDSPRWSLEDAIEIKFDDEQNFLKIVETLTRIGIQKNKELHQVAHLLHKKGKYYIIHYKGMFALDNNFSFDFDIEDLEMQNKIAKLIENWGLAEVIDKHKVNQTDDIFVKVVPWKDKGLWTLVPQYEFGAK